MSLAQQIPQVIADLLKETGHPDIVAVEALATPTVRANLSDGSANYVKVAHVQPANLPPPERPTWPGIPQQPAGAR